MNKYSLLVEDWKPVEDLIDGAIDVFISTMRTIKQSHPEAAIGDTDTDQEIIQEIYSHLHGG